ncbi:hypothetical protein [Vagococcus jeotgali]|uniref:hypothetical protein n=1 Tax=Vagococcus jeotgali TaxID=3109030 RepID=UPI002DD9BDD6|nr:hypothetical protein [Vagococcus sp. B2T-5]
MSNDNPVITNVPTPDPEVTKELHQEIILEENYTQALIDGLKKENFSIILPDEVKVKDKKKGRE